MENSTIPNSHLSPRSKKIRKASKEPNDAHKIYFMSKDEQRTFINELLKRLTRLLQKEGELQKDQTLSVADLATIQAKLKPLYDECLTQVIEKHGKSCGLPMAQWRKKVSEWIKNLDKPDLRGDPIIPQEHDEVFQQRVLAILAPMEMDVRSYNALLREKFIEATRDFRLQEERDNSFSKHWWNDYLKTHPDVKKAWEKMPLKQTFEKQQRETLSSIEKILPHLFETSKISAKTVDYFTQELAKSGNLCFYYQDLIQHPMTDQTSGLEEDE